MSELYARIRSTDVLAWSDPVRALAWQLPWRSLALERNDLTGALALDVPCPDTAPEDLFPKLAAKSWQESGRLRLIPGGLPLGSAIAARLATPTRQQQVVLQAWSGETKPPHLHLFPWRDMTQVSEFRCTWSGDAAHITSFCSRNAVDMRSVEFTDTCALIANTMPILGAFIAQFAVDQSGVTRVLDINPVLTQSDLQTLSSEDLEDATLPS